MEIFLLFIIFIMGTFFGSFFTLAVYRIPLKQDILYTHSYCPNCKHKLNFLDLFPVFSYIFLKGKCRYCGNRIRIRYLLLEILAGMVFLIYALSFNINFAYINFYKIISLSLGLLYFVCLFITSGIDKERIKIENSVLIYGGIISLIYIIYVCAIYKANVYAYAIYLILLFIACIINYLLVHKYKKNNYIVQLSILAIFMLIFTGVVSTLLAIFITSFIILIVKKVFNKKLSQIPIAFYFSIINIMLMIITNFLNYNIS